VADLEEIIDLVKEEKVIICGHSFGGCSAIETGRRNKSGRIKAIVALDPWMFPLDKLMK
jgi:pimeloyl-ACP methyl ester carboxylesterase